MKRKPAAFTPAARAVCSEFLALLELLLTANDPEKTKPLGALVLKRLEKIVVNGARPYAYSDDQLLRALKGVVEPAEKGNAGKGAVIQ